MCWVEQRIGIERDVTYFRARVQVERCQCLALMTSIVHVANSAPIHVESNGNVVDYVTDVQNPASISRLNNLSVSKESSGSYG